MDFLKLHNDGLFVPANLRFVAIGEAAASVVIVKCRYSDDDPKELNDKRQKSRFNLNTNLLLKPIACLY
jgi:hypothetical protein